LHVISEKIYDNAYIIQLNAVIVYAIASEVNSTYATYKCKYILSKSAYKVYKCKLTCGCGHGSCTYICTTLKLIYKRVRACACIYETTHQDTLLVTENKLSY
jgi:hypothetical protein